MSTKKRMKAMSRQELKAIDWASLFAKVSPLVATFLIQLLQRLTEDGVQSKTNLAEHCPDELREACEEECATLLAHVESHLKMHNLIHEGCDEE